MGSSTQALAYRGVHRLAVLCRWRSDSTPAVFSRLSVGIHFLGRHSGGLLGAAHAASSRRRAMGFYDSARVGGGDTDAAAHGLALRSPVVRLGRSLPMGAR